MTKGDWQVMSMHERYKALGAVLALGEFNVPEIAALSGVRDSTVRTILRRESEFVEHVGAQPTGRRGGRRMRWQLRPESREDLRDLLLQLERSGEGPWISESRDENYTPSAALTMASDVLLRLAPVSSDRMERAELVKLAQAHLDAADAFGLANADSVTQAAGRPIDAQRRIVALLLDLERAEQAADLAEATEASREGQELIAHLQTAADNLSDHILVNAIRDRLYASPFGQSWSAALRRTVAPLRPLRELDARLVSEIRRLQQRVRDLESEVGENVNAESDAIPSTAAGAKIYARPNSGKVLTRQQREILRVIRESIQYQGRPPSINEILVAARLKSSSSVSAQLTKLVKLGYLRRDADHLTVAVQLPAILSETEAYEEAPARQQRSTEGTLMVPLMGRIAAGGPILAEGAIEEHIPLPEQLVGGGTLFAVRVTGDSMTDAAITDHDLVVVRQQPIAENGDVVVAMIDGEVTVKMFKRSNDHVRLMPRNSAYQPIIGDEAAILGRVVAVLRRV